MDKNQLFLQEKQASIQQMAQDKDFEKKSLEWMLTANNHRYQYNFSWMGRPIIKFPNDIAVSQEIIWEVKPDLIIETGIAHGGSLIFSASMLELIGNNGVVLGIDIDIREHNRKEIEEHPMAKRIKMIEGSSTDSQIIEQVAEIVKKHHKIMVFLDSLHTHDHVLEEMNLYAPYVTQGSYMVVCDTIIEAFPKGYYDNRPWDAGNNPHTALREFMKNNDSFVIDTNVTNKLGITENTDGYLLKVK